MTNCNIVGEGKISVIVPVYNCVGSLERCLKSICKQTYTLLEIIVVDDGSTDQSIEICKKLATCDNRIRIIEQKNAGASEARNAGLLSANGEYLTFVDADDELVNDKLYENIIKSMEINATDVAIWSWESQDVDKKEKIILEQVDKMPANKIAEKIINDNTLCGGGYPWNKMWRANKLKERGSWSVSFAKDLFAYEDKLFVLQCLSKVGSGTISSEIGYRYYANQNSLSRNKEKFIEILKNGLIAHERIALYYKCKAANSDLFKEAEKKWALMVLGNVIFARRTKAYDYLKWTDGRMKKAALILWGANQVNVKNKMKGLLNAIYLMVHNYGKR